MGSDRCGQVFFGLKCWEYVRWISSIANCNYYLFYAINTYVTVHLFVLELCENTNVTCASVAVL